MMVCASLCKNISLFYKILCPIARASFEN